MATPGILIIKIFWKKGYVAIIFVDGITNKILSRDSNYNVNMVMWPKFALAFCERSYHNLNFISIWPEKALFWKGGLGSSVIIWDWH